MTVYYNEIDDYCCDWLENLIRAKLIPDGVVDRRDIRDILPRELAGYRQCHFFAGLGGWPLALARAGVPPDEPLWTGSCPCQPFSAAGKRGGFADERHLWPYWHWLIRQCGPATILGEQVASAADWLRLVRGDLEALGYAVGCMPVEAASAGADHLRDRFWFVADQQSERLDGGSDPSRQAGRDRVEDGGPNGVALGDAHEPGSQGRQLLPERADERAAWPASMAHPNFFFQGDGGLQRGGQFGGTGGDQEARAAFSLADSGRAERRPDAEERNVAQWHDAGRQEAAGGYPVRGEEYEWVLGADGKARRVKPGIRLLAHGVPARVAKLRAFGNAIDPRPAEAFIRAALNLR